MSNATSAKTAPNADLAQARASFVLTFARSAAKRKQISQKEADQLLGAAINRSSHWIKRVRCGHKHLSAEDVRKLREHMGPAADFNDPSVMGQPSKAKKPAQRRSASLATSPVEATQVKKRIAAETKNNGCLPATSWTVTFERTGRPPEVFSVPSGGTTHIIIQGEEVKIITKL